MDSYYEKATDKDFVEQKINNNAVDNVKHLSENAFKVVRDAAKISLDFAGKQLEQAKVIIDNSITERANKNRIANLEKYKPIFVNEVPKRYPSMIHVVYNDIRMKVKECEGAIGFRENVRDVEIIGIYQKDYKLFSDIEFLPDKNPKDSIYYVHPLNEKQYIDISDYFNYLEQQRVTELENIAQDLGAKYFRVEILKEQTIKEQSNKKSDSKISYGRNNVGISLEDSRENKQYQSLKVVSENSYPGKEPREPKLFFWSNSLPIVNLIKQRMSNDNPLQSKTFILDFNTSTGIKEKEGAKIDGVLQSLKFKISVSIQKIASSESKKRLAYTIEF